MKKKRAFVGKHNTNASIQRKKPWRGKYSGEGWPTTYKNKISTQGKLQVEIRNYFKKQGQFSRYRQAPKDLNLWNGSNKGQHRRSGN